MRVSYVYLLGPAWHEYESYYNLDVQIFTRTEQESSTSYFTGMEYCMGNRLNTMKMQSKQVNDCLYALKLTLNIIVNKAASQQKYELLLIYVKVFWEQYTAFQNLAVDLLFQGESPHMMI